MNKNIAKIICGILFSVVYGLMYKYFGFEITVIVLLIMILIELFIKGDEE